MDDPIVSKAIQHNPVQYVLNLANVVWDTDAKRMRSISPAAVAELLQATPEQQEEAARRTYIK